MEERTNLFAMKIIVFSNEANRDYPITLSIASAFPRFFIRNNDTKSEFSGMDKKSAEWVKKHATASFSS
ncbi:hypothetical protein [Phytobacter sp. V91]|uniref:hypothetical protein n=1 Tax=Phytobacter sp. V91 TaxID=3369425 RepID=UPI003F61D194